MDRLFFRKRAYQGYVGLIDQNLTKKALNITNIIHASLPFDQRLKQPLILGVKSDVVVLHNTISSGLLARLYFSAQHYPADEKLFGEISSRLVIYLSSMEDKFESFIYPSFNNLFPKTFVENCRQTTLLKALFYYVLIYGVARQIHRYQYSRERLADLFPIIDEANTILSALQITKHLVLKGIISERELSAILILHVLWMYAEWSFAKTQLSRLDYLKSASLVLNIYFSRGALKEKDSQLWINFPKMFSAVEDLSFLFREMMTAGDYRQVKGFIGMNFSLKPFLLCEPQFKKTATFEPSITFNQIASEL